jgi:Na+/melibiose symporter-like transporter
VQSLGLTRPAGAPASHGILETLGCIVHGDKSDLANSNVADVAYSLINMIGTAITITVILLSPSLARKFGKKTVAVTGFGLAALGSLSFYLLQPTNVLGMVALTVVVAICYAPTIPLIWAIYADVADFSEWRTGRRATGMIFATIGFALKTGLALGSASILWLMGMYGYAANQAQTPRTLEGIRTCSSIYVGILFAVCTILLLAYPLNKGRTLQIAEELAERRQKNAARTT